MLEESCKLVAKNFQSKEGAPQWGRGKVGAWSMAWC